MKTLVDEDSRPAAALTVTATAVSFANGSPLSQVGPFPAGLLTAG